MTPPPLPAPLWLTFDCYGTLVDWKSGLRRSFRDAARVPADEEDDLMRAFEETQRRKMQGPYTPYATILQDTFREVLDQFGYRCPNYAVDAFLESVGSWEPFPDVSPALIKLAPRYRLAIVSNVDRDILGWTLRR